MIQKPKLPCYDVTTTRLSLFCLNYRKIQELYNRERDEYNRRERERFYNELELYNKKRREGMNTSDIIDGIVDMLDMSEMDIETENNVIEASLDGKKFKITVEKGENK